MLSYFVLECREKFLWIQSSDGISKLAGMSSPLLTRGVRRLPARKVHAASDITSVSDSELHTEDCATIALNCESSSINKAHHSESPKSLSNPIEAHRDLKSYIECRDEYLMDREFCTNIRSGAGRAFLQRKWIPKYPYECISFFEEGVVNERMLTAGRKIIFQPALQSASCTLR